MHHLLLPNSNEKILFVLGKETAFFFLNFLNKKNYGSVTIKFEYISEVSFYDAKKVVM